MHCIRNITLLFVLFILFSGAAVSAEYFFVKKVIDGDTIVLSNDERIRLIGVDTPETNHPSKPVQYYAKEATDFTRKLVEGKEVRLEYDVEKIDKYGRTLAYVYLKTGAMLNAEIIKQGYGFAYTRFPFKYLDKFREYEKVARQKKIGLWADDGKREYKWLAENKIVPIILYPMSGNYWTLKYKEWILPGVSVDSLLETADWVKYKANEFIDEDLEKELTKKGWVKDE